MRTKFSPENTSRAVGDNPLLGLMIAGLPGGIEAQERDGQRQLVASETLPTRILWSTEADFLALGFTFGAPVRGDDLFREATLPTGWQRKGSAHAMWSHIVDERGLERVAVFYKAAFYDRAAHMGLVNVGNRIAQDALYGDDPITAETLRLSLLTDAERADLRTAFDTMRKQIAESPTIYGKYADRLAAADGCFH